MMWGMGSGCKYRWNFLHVITSHSLAAVGPGSYQCVTVPAHDTGDFGAPALSNDFYKALSCVELRVWPNSLACGPPFAFWLDPHWHLWLIHCPPPKILGRVHSVLDHAPNNFSSSYSVSEFLGKHSLISSITSQRWGPEYNPFSMDAIVGSLSTRKFSTSSVLEVQVLSS